MYSRRSRLPLVATAAAASLLLFATIPQLAAKPAWTPIAELLVGSLGESDPVRMSDVMCRCTALNMILAGMATDVSSDMAEHYRDEAHMFIQNGVLIESQMELERTGVEADIPALSNVAIEKVRGMVDGYNEWLDENIAAEGSYFNRDIDMEISSCQLAAKLANQMSNSGSE